MVRWTRVAAKHDVPENGTLQVCREGERICLHNLAGTIYATHDVCTHGQASLADGFILDEDIECPLHQGRFHIPTGKAVGAPCTEDLRTYRVKVEDGSVHIQADGEGP